ncbi:MAG: protoporphyrinogen oxidase [Opitutales bacterium]|nr:protoporphyrinogen oxidase [Opitutales bacterium]
MAADAPQKVLVIGGGIAGLTVAAAHKARGNEVLLLEKSARVGGNVKTVRRDGFLAESGPATFMAEEKILYRFLRDMKILEAAVEPLPSAKKRYILRGGVPRQVPVSPLSALTTPLFSLRGKIRLLGDIVMPRHKDVPVSVADFVRRRIGAEMYDYALNPLVAGIFAGAPEKLDVRYAFPKVWQLDRQYGSLILGTFPNARAKKRSGLYEKKRTFSFPQGMETLPRLLADFVGNGILTDAQLTSLVRGNGRWRAHWLRRGAVCDFMESDGEFDEVVIACPPRAYREILADLPADKSLFEEAERLYYPPVTTITLGYRREQLRHSLDGFGMLVPEKERREILGTLWNSSFLPGRAPQGCVTLTVYLGGARQPEIARKSREEKIAIAQRELSELLGVSGEAQFMEIFEHEAAIPQYNLGYERFVAAVKKTEAAFPRLRFAGNALGGIAVGATLTNALKTVYRD